MADLKVGDILCQGTMHALMWVGGVKPIVHNANKGKFHGVLRQSFLGAFTGESGAIGFFEAFGPRYCSVYRCSDEETAKEAAKFAIGWSTESGSPEASSALLNNQGFLKTRYSDDRMVYAEYHAKPMERHWKVESMFRALKAYARDEAALTPKKGSSCSQFVMYCFQAASIRRMIGDLNIPQQTLELLKTGGGYVKLSQNGDPNGLIAVAQRTEQIFRERALPLVVMNAKFEFAGDLVLRLKATGSGFDRMGFLIPNDDFSDGKALDVSEGAIQQYNWARAQREVGLA